MKKTSEKVVGVWSPSDCRYNYDLVEVPNKLVRMIDGIKELDHYGEHCSIRITKEVFGYEVRLLMYGWAFAMVHTDFEGTQFRWYFIRRISYDRVTYKWWRKQIAKFILRGYSE